MFKKSYSRLTVTLTEVAEGNSLNESGLFVRKAHVDSMS